MALQPAIAAAMNDAPPAPSPLEHPADHIRSWAAGLRAGQGPPEKLRAVEQRIVAGRDRPIPIRIYRPEAMGSLPTIVAAHGGWFAWGDLDILEQPASALAAAADAVVVSVEYALAPEAPFPAGLDDVIALLSWADEHIGDLGTTRIGCTSSGRAPAPPSPRGRDRGARGWCAARRRTGPRRTPTDPALDTESWRLFDGMPKDWAQFYWRQYLGGATPEAVPLACPLRVADLTGLPPTFVLTAEFDPLRDEGEAFALRVASAGVATTARRYLGMPHGMLYLNGISDATRAVTQDVASFINGSDLTPRVEAMDLVLA